MAIGTEPLPIGPDFQKATGNIFGQLADETQYNVPEFIRLGVQFLFVAGAVASFFFLLIGSVQWIMAGGDKEGLDKARKKVTGALIGLAILLSTFAVAALANTVFKVNILGDIPIPKL